MKKPKLAAVVMPIGSVLVVLVIGYLYALPKVETGVAPFAMFIELGGHE